MQTICQSLSSELFDVRVEYLDERIKDTEANWNRWQVEWEGFHRFMARVRIVHRDSGYTLAEEYIDDCLFADPEEFLHSGSFYDTVDVCIRTARVTLSLIEGAVRSMNQRVLLEDLA